MSREKDGQLAVNLYPPSHPTHRCAFQHTPTQHMYHHAHPPSTLFSTPTCQHTQSTYQQAHSCNTPITTPTHPAPINTHPTPINTHLHPHFSTHPANALTCPTPVPPSQHTCQHTHLTPTLSTTTQHPPNMPVNTPINPDLPNTYQHTHPSINTHPLHT